MSLARRRHDWDQAAATIAMIHNTVVTKKSDAKAPADFHPLTPRAGPRVISMKEFARNMGCKDVPDDGPGDGAKVASNV